MSTPFVHLHTHTTYSLLDSTTLISPLIEHVKLLKQPAVAITDHGNLFGTIPFYVTARAAGVKPIIGCEVYMAVGSRLDKRPAGAQRDYYHLILLALDNIGYRNLIRLVSQGYTDGFHVKPRIDKTVLRSHSSGLIALSGCLSGEIPTLIRHNRFADASQVAQEFRDIFGPDRFYLELQATGLQSEREVNTGLIHLHHTLDIPLVATNDCHYLRAGDDAAHDILRCIKTGKTKSDPTRVGFGTNQLYVKSSEEMAVSFRELPEAIANTNLIAERCSVNIPLHQTRLPRYDVPPPHTLDSYLRSLAETGLSARLRSRAPAVAPHLYEQRLRAELVTICSMGFAGYFLIVWDIINFARSRRIPVGPGRGSAAGSLVAYALGITELDPLAYDLLFERFLNPDRVTLPDIDMDFCMNRRQEVINYVVEKYGKDYVARIITFGTLGPKAAIRDVGRVFEIPGTTVDTIAKLIPSQYSTIEQALTEETRLRALSESNTSVQALLTVSESLEGLARHVSTHAAGIVISQTPLLETVPLCRTTSDDIVTQFGMWELEQLGLVKFDFLGLKTLTVIDHAVALINQEHPGRRPFALEQVPMDDSKTFTMLGRGHTTGVFQLESNGMRDLLREFQPDRFEDITAIIALYRPGPIDLIPEFIQRKRGTSPNNIDIPALDSILSTTYGVMVYQEQVMEIAHRVAGFTLGEADILRRAMGKKKPEEMRALQSQFIEGSVALGTDREAAERLFHTVTKFAGYGFNKSHAAAYALITYYTAYLKAHHPQAYMTALMTYDINDHDRLALYASECRERQVRLLPPDINRSTIGFTIVDDSILYGLAAIKHVGEHLATHVIETRSKGGPYTSFLDLCERVDRRIITKRVLDALIKSGALDALCDHRAQLCAVLDDTARTPPIRSKRTGPQQTLLQLSDEIEEPYVLPRIPLWSPAIQLEHEREVLGYYVSRHPVEVHATQLTRLKVISLTQLPLMPDGKEVRIGGLITKITRITTKRRQPMAFLHLEDQDRTMDVVVFPNLYRDASGWLETGMVIALEGILDQTEQGQKVKATRFLPLEHAA
ncbi:MAG: DNA polymerase III subunit alpha [Nitrospira sp.]|nr:DNA polymerase III subunit alpha [Nitrospira sp.]